MIDKKDIEEYIHLCRIFGGCYDFVQTNGGNISIKNKDQIIIKRSGFKMIETELEKGYVICDINKIDGLNENINTSILSGEGTPSIETFFHLLPKKYIVHLHPIKYLHLLSLVDWKEQITKLFGNSLCIEYTKPGLELSEKILKYYNHEPIIFLQNHGIILCFNDIEQLYIYTNYVFNKYNVGSPPTNFSFMLKLYREIKDKIIISSYIPFLRKDRYFYKLSPDISLYLGDKPVTFETRDDSDVTTSNIIIYNDLVYLVGSNYNAVKNLEEMVRTYYLVLESGISDNYVEISEQEKHILKSWDKEKLRFN